MDLTNVPSTTNAASTATNSSKSAKNAALTALADKFPNLNLGIGSKIGAAQLSQSKAKYNVTIDPTALRKMETNASIKANLEETLGNTEKIHDEVERLVAADGQTKLVGVYSMVDKNGKDAGGIVVVDAPPRGGSTSRSQKNMEKLRKELDEKKKMKLEERKRLEEKKAKKKEEEAKADSVELTTTATVETQIETPKVSAPTQIETSATQTETSAAGSGAKIDFSA